MKSTYKENDYIAEKELGMICMITFILPKMSSFPVLRNNHFQLSPNNYVKRMTSSNCQSGIIIHRLPNKYYYSE